MGGGVAVGRAAAAAVAATGAAPRRVRAPVIGCCEPGLHVEGRDSPADECLERFAVHGPDEIVLQPEPLDVPCPCEGIVTPLVVDKRDEDDPVAVAPRLDQAVGQAVQAARVVAVVREPPSRVRSQRTESARAVGPGGSCAAAAAT
eukprot:scaffold18474_cov107-Isochrysis_galbana.AAC.2